MLLILNFFCMTKIIVAYKTNQLKRQLLPKTVGTYICLVYLEQQSAVICKWVLQDFHKSLICADAKIHNMSWANDIFSIPTYNNNEMITRPQESNNVLRLL